MQSPGESSHAYYLLLKSDLFRYHSERMINLILAEAEEVSLAFLPCKSYTPFFSSLISACRELALLWNIKLILRTRLHGIFDIRSLIEYQPAHSLHPLQHPLVVGIQAP